MRNCEISDVKALILYCNLFMMLLGKNMSTVESDKLFFMCLLVVSSCKNFHLSYLGRKCEESILFFYRT
jgi:hypothetical protein